MRPRRRSGSGRRHVRRCVPTLGASVHLACASAVELTAHPYLCSQEEAAEEAKRAKVAGNLGIVVRKPLNQQDMIARDYNAELKSRVGTRTLINPDDPGAAGFYCKETGKTLRDSISYLDHINGKRRACRLLTAASTPVWPGTDVRLYAKRRAKSTGHEHAR